MVHLSNHPQWMLMLARSFQPPLITDLVPSALNLIQELLRNVRNVKSHYRVKLVLSVADQTIAGSLHATIVVPPFRLILERLAKEIQVN